MYQSWLASGSLWTLILVIKSSIASLLPTCPHCVICKSNILFKAVWHCGLLHITEVSCLKVSAIRELRRSRRMVVVMKITNRLGNIWIHCVKRLQSLVAWFPTVCKPCISWRLWVSEPHGCFVCASVYICTPSICHISAASSMLCLWNTKGVRGGIWRFPESHNCLFYILVYRDCGSN